MELVRAICKHLGMGIFDKFKKIVAENSFSDDVQKLDDYGKFIVLDVETTGLNPEENRIVEICLVTVENGEVTEIWSTYFNPEGPVGKTEIHGITDFDVRNAPLFKDKISEIEKRITGTVIVAHNARFDLAFLRSEFERAGIQSPWLPSICTLQVSNYYQPHLPRRRLADCCDDLGIQIEGAHSASGDSLATAKLFHYYMSSDKEPKPKKEHLDLLKNPSGAERNHIQRTNSDSHVRQRIAQAKLQSRERLSNTSFLELTKLLAGCSLAEVLEGENFPFESAYLEKTIEFLSDGEISSEEMTQLQAVAEIYQLSPQQIELAHKTLVKALAIQALKDESVSVSEREELSNVAEALGLSKNNVTDLIREAKDMRAKSLSRNLLELPESWKLGEPLRVGNRVVFTGCDPEQRANLERDSKKAGITISSSVSSKTSMLVTDGSYVGNKANDAKSKGVRVVSPDEYELLLKYVQPALAPVEISRSSSQSGAEDLDPSVVRAWAITQGIEVSPKGRIHTDVYEKYKNRDI
jgi:DNA polymerase-3 subunit epsilon